MPRPAGLCFKCRRTQVKGTRSHVEKALSYTCLCVYTACTRKIAFVSFQVEKVTRRTAGIYHA